MSPMSLDRFSPAPPPMPVKSQPPAPVPPPSTQETDCDMPNKIICSIRLSLLKRLPGGKEIPKIFNSNANSNGETNHVLDSLPNAKATKKPEKPPVKTEKPDSSIRMDKTVKIEKTVRPDKPDKTEEVIRPHKPEKVEKPKLDTTDKVERPIKQEKIDKQDKIEKQEKSKAPLQKVDRTEPPEKASKSDKSDKSDKSENKAENSEKTSRPDRTTDRTDAPDKPNNKIVKKPDYNQLMADYMMCRERMKRVQRERDAFKNTISTLTVQLVNAQQENKELRAKLADLEAKLASHSPSE